MNPQDPDYVQHVQDLFDKAGFVHHIGFKVKEVGPGTCETTLEVQPYHFQQDTFIHAGVQATMADHTAGAACKTLTKENEIVLTVEFKINLLRPAVGDTLRCKATVLRAGRTLIIAESEVFVNKDGQEKMCAKATVTIAVVNFANQQEV